MKNLSILTDDEKENVLNQYIKGYTQTELANHYSVSTRTIRRALEELGEITPVVLARRQGAEAMKVLKEYKLSVTGLKKLLAELPVNTEVVQQHLNNSSDETVLQYLSVRNKVNTLLVSHSINY
jgi:DNA-binding GntR family transcriptional regulator